MTFAKLQKLQPRVVPLLMKSIEKNRLAHAYLFEGNRGTGKEEIALQLVKSYFCSYRKNAEACQKCIDCRRIDNRNHPDVHFIFPDGQSIKKQQVDYLQKEFSYRGVESSKKAYIIYEADLMTASAANSLLKFLEEPSLPTLAILMTTKGYQILPTIKSRCQHLVFSPLPKRLFIEQLEEKGFTKTMARFLAHVTTSEEEVEKMSEGDWIVQARNVVIQLMQERLFRSQKLLFTIQEKWLPLCKERWQIDRSLDMILLWLRDLLYMKVGNVEALAYIDKQEELKRQAFSVSFEQINEHVLAVIEAKKHLEANVNPQLLMENLMLRIKEG